MKAAASRQLHAGVEDVRRKITCGARHKVVVLENLTETAGRLGGGKLHAGFRRFRARRRVENLLHVLARQACAGADEMLDQALRVVPSLPSREVGM
jgi:hypothetical protein